MVRRGAGAWRSWTLLGEDCCVFGWIMLLLRLGSGPLRGARRESRELFWLHGFMEWGSSGLKWVGGVCPTHWKGWWIGRREALLATLCTDIFFCTLWTEPSAKLA